MGADKEYQLSISIAGNTLIPTLHAIRNKGYSVSHYFLNDTPGEWENPQWDAEREGRVFSATSPESLLGLIGMWEIRGDDWRLKDGESEFYDQLVEAAPMYNREGNRIDK